MGEGTLARRANGRKKMANGKNNGRSGKWKMGDERWVREFRDSENWGRIMGKNKTIFEFNY